MSESRKKILTVEDDPDVAALLVILLKGLEAEVLTADCGRRGIEVARAEKPDLVLLDLHLPDLSGMNVLRELRKIPELSSTPIVVLTGRSTPREVQEAAKAGVADFLLKSDFVTGKGFHRIARLLRKAPATDPGKAPLRVLIVDDDESVRPLILALMKAQGAECSEAADGAEALQKAMTASPDLILLDLHLPKQDGLDVMRMLHSMARGADIPVLIMTGSPSVDSVRDSMSLGAVDYLLKSELLAESGTARLKKALAAAESSRTARTV
jgi:CheY-like chemotaxis protein